MANDRGRKAVPAWTRWGNPLRQLDNWQLERMLDSARHGDDTRLQVAFSEIERCSPIFSICISKRISGVASRKWDILPSDGSADSRRQADIVRKMFDGADSMNRDGLDEAMRHLALASFRGRAAVKPFFVDGRLILKKIENWHWQEWGGSAWWNPQALPFTLGYGDSRQDGIERIPDGEIAWIVDEKPLDWAGISIFLRLMIGEDQWARAVEKFGIPQVLLKAPSGVPETDFSKWEMRAQAIYEGGSGILPNGTEVDVLTDARGQDPFTEFCAHQMQTFAVLSTGSSLATLGGTQGSSGAGMGSDVASVQDVQFQQLVNYDAKRIQNAMSTVVARCCRELGEDVKCRFTFVERDTTTPEEYVELALKIRQLGGTVDLRKLKELTQLQIMADGEEQVWNPPGGEV